MNCKCGKEVSENEYLEVSGYMIDGKQLDIDGDIIKVPMCKECVIQIMSYAGFDHCEDCGEFNKITMYDENGTTDPTYSDFGYDSTCKGLCSKCIKKREDYGDGK